MYSGTTFRIKSGRVVGAHQKFDRSARKILTGLLPHNTFFPTILEILHFEGKHGPDGIKSKSPSVDEPWHYIDPKKPDDMELRTHIKDHYQNLIDALAAKDEVRSAYEAAWLAHALTDGLTPAHHYPLSDKIQELWGKPKEDRTTIFAKNVITNGTVKERVSKNWQYWGSRGVFVSHIMFEWGVASHIASMKLSVFEPTKIQLKNIEDTGIDNMFMTQLQRIYDLNMYEEYYKRGWTRKLASQTKKTLAPVITETITLAWYGAVQAASKQVNL